MYIIMFSMNLWQNSEDVCCDGLYVSSWIMLEMEACVFVEI